MLLAYSCLNICQTVRQTYCSLFRGFLFMMKSVWNCQNTQLSTLQIGHLQCSMLTTGGSTAATRGNEGSGSDWSAPAQPSPCHLQASPRRVWACVAFTEKRLPLCQKLRAPPRYTEREFQGWNLKKKIVQTTKRVFSFFWPPPLSNSINHQDQQLNQLNVPRSY